MPCGNGNAIRMIWRKHNARQERGRQAKAGALVAQMTVEEKASQLQVRRRRSRRLGVPATTGGTAALHGVARAGTATMFPQPVAMASMFDEAVMQKIGDVGDRGAHQVQRGRELATATSTRG